MILPSLLEYTERDFVSKLDLISNNIIAFKQITAQSNKQISLHLDFVLPYFAEIRNVVPSLHLDFVFKSLQKYLAKLNLNLSIHLMGTKEDIENSYKFFQNFQMPPNFTGIVFLAKPFIKSFQEVLKSKNNLKTGLWLDLQEWTENTNFEQENIQDFLLMTVLAGKSGQKLELETKQKSLLLAKNNPNKNFILDGGWTMQDLESCKAIKNLNLVSYSSFWNSFS
jgi:pentose-5-phosphate-3-epimerase